MKKRIAKWLLIGLLPVLAYAVFVEPLWVRTKVVEITDANFVDFFKQYRVGLDSVVIKRNQTGLTGLTGYFLPQTHTE